MVMAILKFSIIVGLYIFIQNLKICISQNANAVIIYNDKIISFYNESTLPLTYSQAKQKCQENEGNLLMIKDSVTQQIVNQQLWEWESAAQDTVVDDVKINTVGYWIGANGTVSKIDDVYTSYNWTWSDGTPVPQPGSSTGYENWHGTNPNDNSGYLRIRSLDTIGNVTNLIGGWVDWPNESYPGYICQQTNPCTSDPCQNEGICDFNLTILNFQCNCAPGYAGDTCETDPCATNFCENNGTCTRDNNGLNFTCSCVDGYSGYLCEMDACLSVECKNQGSCIRELEDPYYQCNCLSSYIGQNCENGNFVPSEDVEYSYFVSNGEPTSFNYSIIQSSSYGGALTIIKDNQTQIALESYLNKHITDKKLWIGGRKINREWRWFDNSLIPVKENQGFQNWENIETLSDNGDCLALQQETFKWIGLPCSNIYDFVCEKTVTTSLCGTTKCENGGKCHESGAHYFCECVKGFDGEVCQNQIPNSDSDSTIYIVIGVVVFLLVIAGLAGVYLWRKRHLSKKPDHENINKGKQKSEVYENIALKNKPLVFKNYRIVLSQLLSKYLILSDENNSEINDQFTSKLQQESLNVKTSTIVAESTENSLKNQVNTLLPFDSSRVILEDDTYINASYIDSFNVTKKYIATQSPLQRTVNDFWQMILEKDCSMIVMLNLSEKEKKQCEKYWPEPGKTVQYGNITVKAEQETTYGSYIKRKFQICPVNVLYESVLQHVTQLQFITWPDHGVPLITSSFFHFYNQVQQLYNKQTTKTPIVVHCSAGVGRTGTFIGFDCLMQEMKEKQSVNVFETVLNMRSQRTDMVQTKEQYIFLHKLIAEENIFRNTDINVDKFQFDVKNWMIKEEFNKLDLIGPCQATSFFAKRPENLNKNFNSIILPYDHAILLLPPLPNSLKSVYFNASFIGSYDASKSILAAQTPTDNTVVEFLHSIWHHKIEVVVMLSQMNEVLKGQNIQYWPDNEGKSLSFGCYKVQLVSVQKFGISLIKRILMLTFNKKQAEVIQYQLLNWDEGQPPNSDVLYNLIEKVQESCQQSEDNNLAVHCSDGAGRTGVFIGALNLIERIKNENKIDVLRTVKDMRDMRPGMVENLAQYKALYKIAAQYIDSSSGYLNLNK